MPIFVFSTFTSTIWQIPMVGHHCCKYCLVNILLSHLAAQSVTLCFLSFQTFLSVTLSWTTAVRLHRTITRKWSERSGCAGNIEPTNLGFIFLFLPLFGILLSTRRVWAIIQFFFHAFLRNKTIKIGSLKFIKIGDLSQCHSISKVLSRLFSCSLPSCF